ncbi:MAG: anhydro-N-acetylmuramic acid kinase [Bdellovibrionales bacterium]|nr:anhydro-N-acetylmuramic acid kinase [Ramlibacter sp.]
MQERYIGLMSGTSLDGVDGVLVTFEGDQPVHVITSATEAFTPLFKAELLALNTPGHHEIHRAALAANQLAAVYAQVVHTLVSNTAHDAFAPKVTAIGAHGQTVRHQPKGTADVPHSCYTVQLNNPSLLAELTGIDVVADFRSRDVAAGGQGAPLVPAFHQHLFSRPESGVLVLNLGGIANLSVLPRRNLAAASTVLGFDCGPGNVLMDAWCLQHTGQTYDAGGAWAHSGQLLPELLARLMDEPYFSEPIPKSTGRDLFSLSWLAHKLAPFGNAAPADVQHTLTELTARTCTESMKPYLSDTQTLIVCGGGAFNQHLMARLQVGVPSLAVSASDAHGLPPLQVEATAFAWLARQSLHRRPGNLASVTGAAGPRLLGGIFPA